MNYRQDTRLIHISTSLGKDRLYVASFQGREALSTLYAFTVKAFSVGAFIETSKLVGQPVVVSVLAGGGENRHFHGYVRLAEADGYDYANDIHHCTLEFVPWLWFLTRRTDCRIFQNKSVIEIAEEIFQEFGFPDYDFRTVGDHRPREYCVQYRESSFDFLSRLFEEEGIFYFFEQDREKHCLVLADSADVHRPVPIQDAFRHLRLEAGDAEAAISGWRETVRVASGRVALGDFNFETPGTDLTVGVGTVNAAPHSSDLELYDYPGNYPSRGDGDRRARIRMEEEEALWRVFAGRSNAPMLAPGFAFALSGHEVAGFNARYTLTGVRHEGGNNWDGAVAQGAHYGNGFEAVPEGVVFRPPRRTRRPVVEGPQTAIVVGPPGEEIFVDKYGRVKLQFHWDRRGSGDDKASCWVRVSQGWAGPRWGVMVPPRVGMEVVVEFLEGDPDRPLVTGCLYNRDSMPPYALPGERTKTTIKTRSSPGGGNFNELRFEDRKGHEQIFVHGAKDLDVRITKDRREWIGGARHLVVGGSQFERAGGNRHTTVRGDHNQTVDGTMNRKIGIDHHEEVGLNYAVKAGMEVALEAGMMLTIKAAGSYISLGPAGVTISGPLVLINSGGASGTLTATAETATQPMEAAKADPGDRPKALPRRRLQRPSGNRERAVQAEALRDAARNGTPFCAVCEAKAAEAAPPAEKPPETPPAPADPLLDVAVGRSDNGRTKVLYAQADAQRLGGASGKAGFDLGAVSMDNLGAGKYGGASHKLNVFQAKADVKGGVDAGIGVKAAAEANMIKQSGSLYAGTDANNPLSEVVGEYKLLSAEAKGDLLVGSDGTRTGLALGGKAAADTVSAAGKGEINIPLIPSALHDHLPGPLRKFKDWTISARGEGSVSAPGSVGIGAGGYGYKDHETGRYHGGVFGKFAPLVGGLGIDSDISIGPKYATRERP